MSYKFRIDIDIRAGNGVQVRASLAAILNDKRVPFSLKLLQIGVLTFLP